MRKWAVLALVLVGTVRAEEKNPFEAYEKLSKPGKDHKLLEPLVGDWTYVAKMWMKPGEEKPSMILKGESSHKWLLDGRFLSQQIQNLEPKKDFAGLGWLGFDNAQKKYVAVWIDSMSSGIQSSTGEADKTGKVFTFTYEYLDPVQKEKIKGRDVIRIISNDKHVMEMYKKLGDKEMKMMEIEYTRKK